MAARRGGFVIGFVAGVLGSYLVANASEHDIGENFPEAVQHVYSGHQYNVKGGAFRLGYVGGSLDGFLLAAHFQRSGAQIHDFSDCKNNLTPHQLLAIVDRAVSERPDERDHSAALMSHAALKVHCPSGPPSDG